MANQNKKKKDPLAAAAKQVVKDTASKAVKQTAKKQSPKQPAKQSPKQSPKQNAKVVSGVARNAVRNAGTSTKRATTETVKTLPKKQAKPFKASDLSGNTGRGVTKQARKQTKSAYTGASQRKAQAKQKEKDIKAGKYKVPNRLGQADEMMLSQEGKNQVNYYKDQWEKAKARGDKAGMQKAHEEAEKVRLTNPATVKTTTYEGPTQSQVTMAALQQYAQAMQAGDEEGMRQAKNLAAYAMLNVPKDNREQSYMTGAYSGGTWGDRALEASESDILKNQKKNLLKSEGAALLSAVPEAAGGYIETVMNAPGRLREGSSQLVVKDPDVDKTKVNDPLALRGQSRYTEEDARAKADHYQAQAEYLKQIAYSTTPLPGVAGRFAVDATAAAGGMGIDLAANTVIPGAGLVSMGARTFGSSVQQAKDYQKVNGTDNDPYADAKAYLYGAAIAGTEIASEKMFGGPFQKIYGKGFADAAVKGATKPTIGKTILKGLLEEGTEEVAADIAQWQAPRIYGGETETLPEMLKGAAYDFTLGAALGGLGGAVTAKGQVQQQKFDNLKKRAKATGLSDEEVDRVFKNLTVGELELLTDATDGTFSDWIAEKQSGKAGESSLEQAAKETYGTGLSEKPVQLGLKAKQDRLDALGIRMKKLGLENANITPITTGFAKKKYDNELVRVSNMADNEFMNWLSTQGIKSSQIENQSLTGASGEQRSEQTFESEQESAKTMSPGKAWNALRKRLRESGVNNEETLRMIRSRMAPEEYEEALNLRKNDFLEWRDRVTSPDYRPAPREEAEPTEEITAEEFNVEEEDELSTISPAQINNLGDKLRELGVDSRAVARAISDDAVLEQLVNMDAEELRTWAEEQKAPAKPSKEEVSEMLQEQEEMLAERREREPKASAAPVTGDAALVNAMADYLGDAGRSTMIGRYDPKNIKDASRYVLETRLAYNAGFTGNQISRTMNRVISPETANRMYEAGVMDKQAVHEQRRRKQARAKFYNSNEAGLGRDANGHYLDEYVENLARQSKENAMLLDEIDRTSKAFGAKVLFPDVIEVRNKEGKATETAGGGYTSANIMLGKDLGKALKYTYGHELTHRMAEIDPKAYEGFKKYVMSRPDSEKMYTELQYEYNLREIEADHDRLVEETCAEFSGVMISQADMLRDFAKMADQNIVQRFFQALRDMARKLTGREKAYVERAVKVLDDAYRERYGVSMSREMKAKTTADVKAVGEMYESSLKQARKMAGRPIPADVLEGRAVVDSDTGIKYSYRSMKHDIKEGAMIRDVVSAGIMSQKEANQLMKNINNVVELIENNIHILDKNEQYTKDSRPYGIFKDNSDELYVVSLDFSTMCRKRLLTQSIIERIQTIDKAPLSADRQMKLRELLKKYHEIDNVVQVACGMCYVEAARYKSPKVIQKWLKDPTGVVTKYFHKKDTEAEARLEQKTAQWIRKNAPDQEGLPKSKMPYSVRKQIDKYRDEQRRQYKLSAEQKALLERIKAMPAETFLTEQNLTKLLIEEPEIYNIFTSNVRSATRSKPVQGAVPAYYGDSASVSDRLIEKMNRENGIRFQSWSDWQVQHLLDMMTAVIDLSVRGAKMHGYTKYPEEVRIFGRTGMQFNMSGVLGTVDPIYDEVNGKKIYSKKNFDTVEGVDIDEALEVRDKFPETAAMQCIGVSDEQIKALLLTDWIDYVIPYHASGLSKALRTIARIEAWTDYTKKQEAKPKNKDAKPGPNDDAENWHKEPVFSEFMVWEGENGLDCMRKSAKRYVELCEKRGMIPKFNDIRLWSEQQAEDNYWKLLIDRKMINQKTGEIIIQQPVKPDFDFDAIEEAINAEVSRYDPNREDKVFKYAVEHMPEVGMRPSKALKNAAAQLGENFSEELNAEENEPPVLYSIKRTKRQEKRDNGEKLTENQFYGLYSAHIIAGGRQADDPVTERTVEGIKENGFQGDGGPFGANVLPTSSSSTVSGYTVEELKAQGKGESTIRDLRENPGAYGATWIGDRLYYNLNDTMRRYGARKGQTVLLVPESDVDKNDKIRTGFKPFDYEIVTVERDFQPYYELYSKAYDEYKKNGGTKYSIRARDSEYLQAVRDGDMEKAQRIIDEAAKEAGYDSPKLYHGTDYYEPITVFKGGKSGYLGPGIYLTPNKGIAKRYATKSGDDGTIYTTVANIKNPLVVTSQNPAQEILRQITGSDRTYNNRKAKQGWDTKILTKADMKKLQAKGYDGIIWRYESSPEEYLLFDSNQIKSADPVVYDDNGNVIPLSERFDPNKPDIRWALRGNRTVEELAAAYGIIPPGEKRAREVRVPQRTEDDNRVSRAIRTIMEAQTTPEQLLPRIEEMIANGEFSYSPITNKESVARARATINELGYDEAWRKWSNDIDDRKASSDVVTLGWILYDDALKDGNVDKALEICAKMARFGSQLGQAVQAMSILKRLPTELQMRMIPQPRPKHVQDKIDEYENDEEDWEEKDDVFAPDEYDEETGLPKPKKPRKPREKKKPTQEEVDQMEIDTAKYQIEHSKITLKDKWDAWRYLAMLLNVRTHLRNLAGNLGFAPIIITKNLTATVSEIALYNTFGKNHGMQRTKGFYGISQFHYAWNDFKEMRPIIMGEAKFEGQENKPDKVVFRGILAPIEKLRRFNSRVLDKEDAIFSKPQYANALAQFMAANGITVEMMETGVGKIEKGPHKGEEFNSGIMQEARAYAVLEAQKATYRDLNNISKLFMRLGKVRDPNNSVEKFTNILVEGIFPFRKTPANILCRSVEYSPAGFANGMWKLTWGVWNTCRIQNKVQRGEKLKDWEMKFKPVTVAEALDRLCSGLSGTGIFILGMYLAKMGLLVAKSDDGDDNQMYFDKLLGHQQWALEIFDYSVTIDWLAPEVVPLFMGAQYFTTMSSGNPIRNVSNMLDSATMILDPVMELSCLSGIQETLNNTAKFAEGDLNTMTSLIASMGLSYLTQGVPTLFGQFERVSQADRMQTFATEDPDAMFSEDWQYQIGKISAKIPGRDFQQVPYIDSWGNTETETNFFKRVVANMINPAYIKKIDTRDVNKELQRLYDVTGDGYVFPKPVWKSYNFKDENGVAHTYYLTEDEWVATSRAKGRESFDLVQKFMNSKAYKDMSDPDRADMISDLYSYADYKASKAYIHNYRKELSSATKWIEKYEAFSDAVGGYDVISYKILDRKVNNVTGVKKNPTDRSKAYTTACAKLIALYDSGADIPTDPEKRDALMEALDISPKVRNWNRDAAKAFNDKEWRKLGVEPPA